MMVSTIMIMLVDIIIIMTAKHDFLLCIIQSTRR